MALLTNTELDFLLDKRELTKPQKRYLKCRLRKLMTLQNAPRDADKLEQLIKIKRRQKEEATYIENTQRLVAEIEMLRVVRYLVCRNLYKNNNS